MNKRIINIAGYIEKATPPFAYECLTGKYERVLPFMVYDGRGMPVAWAVNSTVAIDLCKLLTNYFADNAKAEVYNKTIFAK